MRLTVSRFSSGFSFMNWSIFKDPIKSTISNSVSSLSKFTNNPVQISSNSLKKLTTLGFVTKCKNNKKIRSGGRPAEVLYETVHLSAIKKNIISNVLVSKVKIILINDKCCV